MFQRPLVVQLKIEKIFLILYFYERSLKLKKERNVVWEKTMIRLNTMKFRNIAFDVVYKLFLENTY